MEAVKDQVVRVVYTSALNAVGRAAYQAYVHPVSTWTTTTPFVRGWCTEIGNQLFELIPDGTGLATHYANCVDVKAAVAVLIKIADDNKYVAAQATGVFLLVNLISCIKHSCRVREGRGVQYTGGPFDGRAPVGRRMDDLDVHIDRLLQKARQQALLIIDGVIDSCDLESKQ